MKVRTIFLVIVVTIAFSFFFIACGGEETKDPINNGSTDDIDDLIDETDGLEEEEEKITDENSDENNNTPPCSESYGCQEICKNFLDMEGKWSIVKPTTVSGEIILTLSVSGENCKIAVTGRWEFEWEGTEIHQLGCSKEANTYSFFSLQEMEGEKLVIRIAASQENCESGQGTFYKFEKIQ